MYKDPNRLPKLPNEFQTRMEINMVNQKKSVEVLVLYDLPNFRAEIVKRDPIKSSRDIYYFDKNEQFHFEDGKCTAKKLNESNTNVFFGLVSNGANGINMKPPNYFLHFNNNFPHVTYSYLEMGENLYLNFLT